MALNDAQKTLIKRTLSGITDIYARIVIIECLASAFGCSEELITDYLSTDEKKRLAIANP